MAIDWSKNFKKYKGLWVAMKNDEITVIASDRTAKGVLEKSCKKGLSDPILFKVPTEVIPQIGIV